MSGKFEVFKIPKNNQFYFRLKASNGEVIGTSEQYTSEKARDDGIKSVKKNAPTAEMIDLTKFKK